jgi:hypothetical protein
MVTPYPSDEELVAYADGELDLARTRSITAAMADDPLLAARVEGLKATRARLKEAFAGIAHEPVPPSLTRFVMSGGAAEAISSEARTEAPRRPARSLPLAAALAGLLVGATATWVALRPATSPPVTAASMASALEVPLGTLADGSSGSFAAAGTVALRQTVRTRAGLCRSFTVTESPARSYDGVACRVEGAWQVQVMALASNGNAFVPAGAAGPVDAFLDAAEAGDPLPADAVKRLIDRRWAGD